MIPSLYAHSIKAESLQIRLQYNGLMGEIKVVRKQKNNFVILGCGFDIRLFEKIYIDEF